MLLAVPDFDTDTDGSKAKSYFPDQIRLRRTSGGADTCDVLKANAANPARERLPEKGNDCQVGACEFNRNIFLTTAIPAYKIPQARLPIKP